MRAPQTKTSNRAAAKPPLVEVRALWQLGVFALLMLIVAVQTRPQAAPKLNAPNARAPSVAEVRIPAEDRERIDSWPKFFACYDLVQYDLITATLRKAGYADHPAWDPKRVIQVPLAAPPPTPGATAKENAVGRETVALAKRMEAGQDPCARK